MSLIPSHPRGPEGVNLQNRVRIWWVKVPPSKQLCRGRLRIQGVCLPLPLPHPSRRRRQEGLAGTEVLLQSHLSQRLGGLVLPSKPAFTSLSLWLREQGASCSLGLQQEEMEGSVRSSRILKGKEPVMIAHSPGPTSRLLRFCCPDFEWLFGIIKI